MIQGLGVDGVPSPTVLLAPALEQGWCCSVPQISPAVPRWASGALLGADGRGRERSAELLCSSAASLPAAGRVRGAEVWFGASPTILTYTLPAAG